MSHSDFGILPREIYVEVAKYSTKPTRKNLCLVSKPVNELLSHLMYENVDISLHDSSESTSTILKHIYLHSATIAHRHDHLSATWHLPDLQLVMRKRMQQDICLQMLMARPAYATYVKNLKWTILTTGDPIESIDRPDRDEHCQLWHVLGLMKNVNCVDIANGPMADATDISDSLSVNQPLFPSATSVRLAGVINNRLANAILHDRILEKIQHLEIDNMSEVKLDSGVQIATLSAHTPEHVAARWNPTLFARISGKCTALKSFKWRKLWEPLLPPDPSMARDAMMNHGLTITNSYVVFDRSDYRAGVAFVDSVRPHLEHLVFDRSFAGFEFYHDRVFTEFLQPILLERSWPCLKSLYLTATLPWHLQTSDLNFSQAAGRKEMLHQLRLALGPDVKLVVPMGASDAVWETGFVDIYVEEERRIRRLPNSNGSSLNI